MKRLSFNTTINAPAQKVWEILWGDESYREWTSVFSPGSHVKSDFKEGSKVLFLDGNNNGMFSRVEKTTPNEYISFKHLGEVKDGVEQPITEETKNWSGYENYTLTENNGVTRLEAEVDLPEDHIDQFNEIFPKSLEIVKRLAEQQTA